MKNKEKVMRKNKLIVANWKVNGSTSLCEEYKILCDWQGQATLVVCPPYPYLSQFNPHKAHIGTQNVSIYQSGSHTSHVSVNMLKFSAVRGNVNIMLAKTMNQ